MTGATRAAPQPARKLSDLRNIGRAMLADFKLLKISSVAQLASCSADELYARLQEVSQTRHDPCVWDTFAAAIHQAKTGEALDWWHFTAQRKRRQAAKQFP